jgi:hypothetical protein
MDFLFCFRDVPERLPYCVPIDVNVPPPSDYPSNHRIYNDVFFLPAAGRPKGIHNPYTSTPRKERFFIDPEWASEKVSRRRFLHKTNPEACRYSWM